MQFIEIQIFSSRIFSLFFNFRSELCSISLGFNNNTFSSYVAHLHSINYLNSLWFQHLRNEGPQGFSQDRPLSKSQQNTSFHENYSGVQFNKVFHGTS